MYALQDRATALEIKFAHDQDVRFRAESRRTKSIGLWAAALLGLADAEAYARDLMFCGVEGAPTTEIATKLRHDFDTAGVRVADDELADKMRDLLSTALRQLEAA
ncbi:MAG: ATPase inhibitor subunit zeta [Neorhizobium sp.]|jgi:hypothetical protein|nr:ATPase inhibitor subunit zeta [Neorhizobium sp.]